MGCVLAPAYSPSQLRRLHTTTIVSRHLLLCFSCRCLSPSSSSSAYILYWNLPVLKIISNIKQTQLRVPESSPTQTLICLPASRLSTYLPASIHPFRPGLSSRSEQFTRTLLYINPVPRAINKERREIGNVPRSAERL